METMGLTKLADRGREEVVGHEMNLTDGQTDKDEIKQDDKAIVKGKVRKESIIEKR